MGLERFNKKNISRRDVLRGGLTLAASALVTESIAMPSTEEAAQLNNSPEQIEFAPTPEAVSEDEVRSVLRELLGDGKQTDLRKLEDENGLYLLEVKVPEHDGHTEYAYRRGRREKGQENYWVIDKEMYNQAGDIESGHPVAKRLDGAWKRIA